MIFPPFHSFPILENQNILLREVQHEDSEFITEISYYDGQKANSIAQAKEMNNKINKNYKEGDSIHWLILEKNTHQIAGTCGYYRGFTNNSGEIGCILLPEFQGKGIMQNALRLIIDFATNEMKLNRIWAATSIENHQAIKLFNRLGFHETKSDENTVTFDF
ncbi:GNAT family N-acetyltransferase [Moheibacter sediminis]|uniref:Ribosomal-protein-alanine N-acetyltransferase n=1 Tax=Moheibacter sediminis TaxID=1434700 RepID=A0A1W2AFZ0_9FLAO|nr:GNAT family N-acetyltransferase [Moheibacter sediminis]SMC59607.1 ribosomal-protein-alanine N-acetyltransferase [Moheibacter sediminis]